MGPVASARFGWRRSADEAKEPARVFGLVNQHPFSMYQLSRSSPVARGGQVTSRAHLLRLNVTPTLIFCMPTDARAPELAHNHRNDTVNRAGMRSDFE